MKKKTRNLLIVAAVIFVLIIIFGLGDGDGGQSSSRPGYDSQSYDGDLTWAVYWYICGSDLETNWQAASDDIAELMRIKLPGNVKVIIQTGGAERWHSNSIRANELGRYVYDNTGFKKLEAKPSASMGDPQTLKDFLGFCLDNYPAEKQALVFWDHGGGSLGGVCWDEIYENILSLSDISNVLDYYQNGYQEPRFELIGFDACLMATVDTAFSLLGYTRYMVASEEVEPGIGWEYMSLANALAVNPGINGAELGRAICDSFQAACARERIAEDITLSVIDITRTLPLFAAYDSFGFELLSRSVESSGFFSSFSRMVKNLENYGGNSRSEGYTNMVEMGHMAREGRRTLSLATGPLLDALNDCVIYKIAGPLRKESTGLACYYPLDSDRDGLSVFAGVGTSRNFSAYYEYVLTGRLPQNARDFLTQANYSPSRLAGAPVVPSVSVLDLDDFPVKIDDDGFAILNLGPQKADSLSGVYNWIMYNDLDQDILILLGRDNNLDADWERGIFTDNFYGEWTTLDGHLVYLDLTFEGDDYNLYQIPILLNGSEYHLQVSYSFNTEEYSINGARRGLESSGMSSKHLRQLSAGDEITTLFYIFFDMEDEDEDADLYEYETFKIGATQVLMDTQLPDGDYYYLFEMEDAQGESAFSEAVIFNIEDGELYYY